MRGIGGVPKFAADVFGTVAAYICILCGALQSLDEHRLNVQATLWQIHRPGLGNLLALGAVQAILTVVGLCVVVVPGLYLMTIWAVAMPVLLVEETGFVDGFRRSAELASERGWRIFGACIVCALMAAAAFALVSLVLRVIPIMTERVELQSLLHWLVGSMVLTFVLPLSAVLYVLLRQEKEGLTVSQIVGTLH